LLVFDEVMTGFRIAVGGATERFGVTPDLVTLGKVIGGGVPVAAYGGRRDLMEQVAPSGPVYQAGTLSGNPLAMAAGIATLRALTPDVHEAIASRTRALVEGLRAIAARRGVPFTADSAGSMFGFFFREEPVRSFADAKTSDVELFRRFFHAALERGVYLAPSAFEAGFTSAAHGDAEIALTLERLDSALAEARA
jgi:glutamate-1-semialdehyde 2,1-aminomutase